MISDLTIVTVCPLGESASALKLDGGYETGHWPAGIPEFNRTRLDQLDVVVGRILERDWHPDVIQLPGGFLALGENDYLGDLTFQQRANVISSHSFNARLISVCQVSGAAVITGLDGPPNAIHRDRGDQLCAAWDASQDASGPIAIARKVFPEKSEARESDSGNRLLVYADDYESPFRTFNLRGKGTGLLCVCYDLYGCGDLLPTDLHARNVTRLAQSGVILTHGRGRLRLALSQSLVRWQGVVSHADAIFACVHGFSRRHCGTGYWTRHAFRRNSSRLPFVPIVGAAHFSEDLGLPSIPQASSFMALEGTTLEPIDSFYLMGALVRLYSVRRPAQISSTLTGAAP